MTQVTIANVLRAAEIGRAPLAAESAGYLALAVADQLVRAPLSFDPGGVLLSNEGTVSVGAGRRGDGVDAERIVRSLLGRLLSVAPSSTPALGAAARRSSGQGVGALVDELEGALIPVNRSAARRAIARLARETSKAEEAGLLSAVELDAFEHVAPAPRTSRREAPGQAPRQVDASPPRAARPRRHVEQAAPAVEPEPPPVLHVDTMLPRVEAFHVDVAEPPPEAELAPIEHAGDDATSLDAVEHSTNPLPVEVDHHTAPLPFGAPMPELPQGKGPLGIIAPAPRHADVEVHVYEGTPLGIAPLAPNAAPVPPAHAVVAVEAPAPEAQQAEPPSSSLRLRTRPAATVDELLAKFAPSEALEHDELRGILKRTAGLEPTPPPPGATLRADDPESGAPPLTEPEITTMASPSDDHPDPLPNAPMARRAQPRAGTGLLATLLLVGVAATIFVYARYPAFFSGH